MQEIPTLTEQLQSLLAKLSSLKDEGFAVTKVEINSDLYRFLLANLPKGGSLPEEFIEDPNLLPGNTYLHIFHPIASLPEPAVATVN